MLQEHRVGRIAFASVLGVAFLVGATVARGEATASPVAAKGAKKDNLACLATYESAQQRERTGHLVEASQLYLTCAGATCGKSLRQECASKNGHLSAGLASVVLTATDMAGKPLTDVQVTLDGQPFASRLDGQALPIDPGSHELSFRADGKVFASQKLTISKGERNRTISVSQKPAGVSGPKGSVSVR